MFHLLLALIYLAFISLGLPDSLLGSAWPTIYRELDVPLSYASIVFAIISLGTVISSLESDRVTRRFGTGLVTAVSVAMTACALFGFSISRSFIALCLIAVPYGLGAGSVDASLNNYVALHYESRHMSWLHCMWGVGATLGPYIMGSILTGGGTWQGGYRVIFAIQIVLSAILFLSLPLWKKSANAGEEEKRDDRPLRLSEIVKIPGAKELMLCFFCYCALEQTTGLWAASYLTLSKGISADLAASLAGLFFIGITAGRAVSGFVTFKLNDSQMIKLGMGIIAAGVLMLLLPLGKMLALAGFVIIGLGCAPIYPCVIHSTPEHFGEDRSQAVIGVQMASAYIGIFIMPPVFGLIAQYISVSLFPWFIGIIEAVMVLMYLKLEKATA